MSAALAAALALLPALPWSESNAHAALSALRSEGPSIHPKAFTLDLDAPPATRWDHIAPAYSSYVPDVMAYLESAIPKWALPLVEAGFSKVIPYFGELGEEITGAARALRMSPGALMVINLVMQVEQLGLNCSSWNTTGPTRPDDPGCVDIDPSQQWCFCRAAAAAGVAIPPSGFVPVLGTAAHRRGAARRQDESGEEALEVEETTGMCTSVVAQSADGKILHGRNLDWNLPPPMRRIVVDLTYVRGNETVATGTAGVGFVGAFNGMRRGAWSASINARGKGGKLLANIVQSLLTRSLTPSQHLREVLTSPSRAAESFDGAVGLLCTSPLIDENYYIVAGTKPGEGAVVTRGRERAVDVERLDPSKPDGWFLLQTNYDHWRPVPSADDRRAPGKAHMRAIGPAAIDAQRMYGVMLAFPTFNLHTDYTATLQPATGLYNGTVWLG